MVRRLAGERGNGGTSPSPPAARWYPAGGVTEAGDVAGGAQAGASHRVRYFNDTHPQAVVEVVLYAAVVSCAAEHGQPPSALQVAAHVQAEWIICADRDQPHGTELWSDTRCFQASPPGSVHFATHMARQIAEALAAGFTDYMLPAIAPAARDLIFRWRGSPPDVATILPLDLLTANGDAARSGEDHYSPA